MNPWYEVTSQELRADYGAWRYWRWVARVRGWWLVRVRIPWAARFGGVVRIGPGLYISPTPQPELKDLWFDGSQEEHQ